MSSVLQRINQIAENEGVTITAFEQLLGASKGVLSKALAKNTDIQSKWLQRLVENYPHYNVEWLLTGKGQMLKSAPAPERNKIRLYQDMAMPGIWF